MYICLYVYIYTYLHTYIYIFIQMCEKTEVSVRELDSPVPARARGYTLIPMPKGFGC